MKWNTTKEERKLSLSGEILYISSIHTATLHRKKRVFHQHFDKSSEVIESAKTGLPLWMLGLGADLLWADMNRLLAFLFHQGVLDEQFLQLQQLQDETSPNFVSEVVNIYFHESEKLLTNLRSLLMEREFCDYKKMGNHLNQLMGSSSSIGAKRVRNVCVAFRGATEQNNRAGCLRALEMLEHEYCYLKNKLHELFQIEQQRALAAGVRYPVQQN